MDWLKCSAEGTLKFSVNDVSENWHYLSGIRIAGVCFALYVGLFEKELKVKLDMKDSMKSCEWNMKMELFTEVLNCKQEEKTVEKLSYFCMDTTNTTYERSIVHLKRNLVYKLILKNNNGYNPFKRWKMKTKLTILDSHGMDNLTSMTLAKRLESNSDVTLVVHDKDIRVNKGFLSTMSEYFYSLFNGNFNEKGKEKIVLKEVSYEEFVDFMLILHGIHSKVTDDNVTYLLELSSLYQVHKVKRLCENYLLSKNIYEGGKIVEMMNILALSDMFQLSRVQEKVVDSLKTLKDLHLLMKQSKFNNLSDSSKAFILKKGVESS